MPSRLDKNRIEKLPNEMGQLKSLRVLALSDNALADFPEVLCECHALKELWLENNTISTLPNAIDALKELSILAMSTNAFRTMPFVLSQLRSLKDLRLGR